MRWCGGARRSRCTVALSYCLVAKCVVHPAMVSPRSSRLGACSACGLHCYVLPHSFTRPWHATARDRQWLLQRRQNVSFVSRLRPASLPDSPCVDTGLHIYCNSKEPLALRLTGCTANRGGARCALISTRSARADHSLVLCVGHLPTLHVTPQFYLGVSRTTAIASHGLAGRLFVSAFLCRRAGARLASGRLCSGPP